MSDDILLPVHGIDHAERLRRLIAEHPHRMHGATVLIERKELDMQSIYLSVRQAYSGVVKNLREMGYISEHFTVADDFSVVGFPLQIPNLPMLEAIDIVLGNKDGMLLTEVLFQYRGATALMYTSGTHTGHIFQSLSKVV